MQFPHSKIPVDEQHSRYAFFETDLAGKPPSGIGIALVGYEQTLSQYRIQRNDFPCIGLEFVTGGKGQLILGAKTYPLTPGVAFAYGPGIAHQIESSTHAPLIKYFIDLYGEEVEQCPTPLQPGTALTGIACNRIGMLIEGIIEDSNNNRTDPEINADVARLILRLAGRRVATATHGGAYQTYSKARNYIEQKYCEINSIAEVAQAVHCAPGHLNRLFRRFSKETPLSLMTRLRMSRASQLLLHHGLPIKTVAESVGYHDPFHFSTRFKGFHGRSPKNFRAGQ